MKLTNDARLSELLSIKRGITSFVGGGGKTTLIHCLADELRCESTVIITTTTHIRRSDVFFNFECTDSPTIADDLREKLKIHRCVCVGTPCEDDKLSAPSLSMEALLSMCDYLLVEADGARMLPLKAHLSHEPVVPEFCDNTVSVVGVDCIGKRLSDVTHRAERACALLGVGDNEIVTPKIAAGLLNAEKLHNIVLINKCDTPELCSFAQLVCDNLNTPCVIASLLKGEYYAGSN